MADGFSIRRLAAADAVLLAELRTFLWPADPAEHRTELDRLFDSDNFTAFVAETEGRAIGWAEASLREYANGANSSPVGYLEGIWVLPSTRRSGVARRLLEAVEQWAAGHGCAEVASDASIENQESHAWHAAVGFSEAERVVCYIRRLGQ